MYRLIFVLLCIAALSYSLAADVDGDDTDGEEMRSNPWWEKYSFDSITTQESEKGWHATDNKNYNQLQNDGNYGGSRLYGWKPLFEVGFDHSISFERPKSFAADSDDSTTENELPSPEEARRVARVVAVRGIHRQIKESIASGSGKCSLCMSHLNWVMPLRVPDELPEGYTQKLIMDDWWTINWSEQPKDEL